MLHYDWNQMPAEKMNPHTIRRVLHTDAMTIARLSISKGGAVPSHKHINEQVATVEKGALKFDLDGQEIVVSSGQSLAIPPNVPHGVVALEDTIVVDVFTPRRQDWIDGDDSYLRK